MDAVMVWFPWPAILALALALIAMTALAWRERRRNASLCATIVQAIKINAELRATAYADGLALGLKRGYGEALTVAYKAWQRGQNPALAIRTHAGLSLPGDVDADKKAAA